MAAALALLTSLAYGLSNYVGPRLARGAPLYVLLIAGQFCSFVLAGVVVLAQGDALPGSGAIAAALLAGMGNAAGLVLLYRAAALAPLSIVMPVTAVGGAVPVAYGLATGETLTALKLAGIVLALGGLALVARRPGPVGEPARDRPRALLLAAASALCFGVFLAAMGPASEEGTGWAVMLSRVSLLLLLVAAAVWERAPLRVAAGRLPALTVPGLLLFAGTLSYAAATQQGDISVVSVLSSLAPVATVALAIALDRERLSPSQAVGVVATLAGVVVLSAR